MRALECVNHRLIPHFFTHLTSVPQVRSSRLFAFCMWNFALLQSGPPLLRKDSPLFPPRLKPLLFLIAVAAIKENPANFVLLVDFDLR